MSPNLLPVEIQCERCLMVICKTADTNLTRHSYGFAIAHLMVCSERFMVKFDGQLIGSLVL